MLRVHVVIGALMPSNFFSTLAPLRLHISTLEGGRAQQLPRAANYPGQRRPQKNVWLNVTGVVEGGNLTVSRPKNKGRNQDFTSDAPVFMTAPQEVTLWRGKRVDDYETEQMRSRIKYRKLTHTFAKEERKEAPPCGHCGARVYLEGRSTATPVTEAASSSADAAAPAPRTPPKRKTGQEMVQALKDLKDLKDACVLDTPELQRLKAKVLSGD